eukprot:SAG31_NODE_230_length_19771_cov_90.041739_12_plen_74_part_00
MTSDCIAQPMHPEVPVEQEPLAADDRPWGVAVVEWLAKRGVRAHKVRTASLPYEALNQMFNSAPVNRVLWRTV